MPPPIKMANQRRNWLKAYVGGVSRATVLRAGMSDAEVAPPKGCSSAELATFVQRVMVHACDWGAAVQVCKCPTQEDFATLAEEWPATPDSRGAGSDGRRLEPHPEHFHAVACVRSW